MILPSKLHTYKYSLMLFDLNNDRGTVITTLPPETLFIVLSYHDQRGLDTRLTILYKDIVARTCYFRTNEIIDDFKVIQS